MNNLEISTFSFQGPLSLEVFYPQDPDGGKNSPQDPISVNYTPFVGEAEPIYTHQEEAATRFFMDDSGLHFIPSTDKKIGLVKAKYFQFLHIGAGAIRSIYSAIGTGLNHLHHLNHPIIQSIFATRIHIPTSVTLTLGKIYSALDVPMTYVKGLSIFGIPFGLIKLVGNVRKIPVQRGWKRFASAMKATRAMSVLIDSTVKTTIGLEAFKFSAELGKKGYFLCEKGIHTIVNWSTPLGVISSILSSATLAIDILTLRESENYFKAIDDRLITEILAKKNPAKLLKKTFLVDGEALKVVCNHRTADKELIKTLKDRKQTVIKQQRITVLATTINLLATALVFTSFLHPVGYIGVGVYVGLTTVNFFYRQISTYNFVNEMDMIDRDLNAPIYNGNLVRRIVDFSKWSLNLHSHRKFEKQTVFKQEIQFAPVVE